VISEDKAASIAFSLEVALVISEDKAASIAFSLEVALVISLERADVNEEMLDV
jgi:hypothetical protein